MASAANTSSQGQFLYLDTKGWKTGKRHLIEIWFVNLGDKYYVMSEHGMRSHWIQNIIHDHAVFFSINGITCPGTARIVRQEQEPKLAAEVSKSMYAKYQWDDGLIIELKPAS